MSSTLSAQEEALLEALLAAKNGQQAREEAERLSQSLIEFVQAAWPHVEPSVRYLHNWHISAICEHLEACSRDQIERLQIWVPRRSMKSRLVSVLWPAWEWTREPGLRYFSASYELRLAGRLSAETRDLMLTPWYQARWGHKWRFTREGERYYANDQGGTRLATGPDSSGLGEHANRILIDDIINAKEAEANSGVLLNQANEWYDATVPGTRLLRCSEVIVMQRLHENDVAAHVMDTGKPWVVLCLPERYEAGHPYAWRTPHHAVHDQLVRHGLADGDPRQENELLWPEARDEDASNEMAATLKSYRAAGQMQQRPAAREGEILKTDWWRFYDPRVRNKEDWGQLGRFGMIVVSVDCPLKDKESSDNVAVQCWGVRGADRYLLDLRLAKMNYGAAKRTVKEMAVWARRIWRGVPHYLLIENAGYGVEMIDDLKRELTGVQKLSPGQDGNKTMRAETASDALESGNCFLPGYGPPWQPAYDEHKTPADIVAFVSNCARFPNAAHDDDVDAWSQTMNWLRGRSSSPMRTGSALKLAARRVLPR